MSKVNKFKIYKVNNNKNNKTKKNMIVKFLKRQLMIRINICRKNNKPIILRICLHGKLILNKRLKII